MKLTNKIPALIAIPLVVCFIILCLVNYSSSKTDSLSFTDKAKENGLNATMLYVDSYFNSRINFIEQFSPILANSISEDNQDENIFKILKNYLGISNFSALFIGMADSGKFYYISSNNEPYIVKDQDARSRGWYKDAISANRALLGKEVYPDERLKEKVMTISAPIIKNGKIIGVIGGDMAFKDLKNQILTLHFSKTNTIFAYDDKLEFVMHPNEEFELKQDDVIKMIENNLKDGISVRYTFKGDEKTAVCINSNTTGWKFCSTNLTSDIDDTLNSLLKQNITLFFASLVIILLCLFFLIKFSLRPLEIIQKGLREVFALINHERKTASKIDLNSKDEFGDMAKAINENIERTINSLTQDTN
ncbi:cache domain-containing protein, partial [Campylobacter sp. RM12637]|uniref:cache domain-containing protein n=2 Tax=unclassified Campylobacter TaxID=2593542 RepID=UPI003014CDEC|nr:cache domain-containing protein [Campylobacter sp. RM12637]